MIDVTRCFFVEADFGLESSLNYDFSPGREKPSPYPSDMWSALRDMSFDDKGRFTAESRREIAKLTMRINPYVTDIPDVIGGFTTLLTSPPAFNTPLQKAIGGLDSDLCDFLAVDRIWDRRHARDLPGLGFALASILPRVDSWDRDKCRVAELKRSDGTTWSNLEGIGVVRASALTVKPLWREASTLQILCTDVFKDLVQDVGCRGIRFREIAVSQK